MLYVYGSTLGVLSWLKVLRRHRDTMTQYTTDGPGSLAHRIAQRAPQEGCVPLPLETVQTFLVYTAMVHDETGCNTDGCDACNAFLLRWWEACMRLTRIERIAVQKMLRLAGIPLPAAPWEVVS